MKGEKDRRGSASLQLPLRWRLTGSDSLGTQSAELIQGEMKRTGEEGRCKRLKEPEERGVVVPVLVFVVRQRESAVVGRRTFFLPLSLSITQRRELTMQWSDSFHSLIVAVWMVSRRRREREGNE